MVLDEKGIAAEMKAAYRAGGYTVYMPGDGIMIYTESWACLALKKTDLKKVLAVLVEHIGEIPERNHAYHISKNEGVQAELAASAQATRDKVLRIEGEPVTRTIVRLEDARVYQDNSLKAYAVMEPAMRIIDEGCREQLLAGDEFLRCGDEESKAAVWYSTGEGKATLLADIMCGLSTIQMTAV